jgi:hypothetical protein
VECVVLTLGPARAAVLQPAAAQPPHASYQLLQEALLLLLKLLLVVVVVAVVVEQSDLPLAAAGSEHPCAGKSPGLCYCAGMELHSQTYTRLCNDARDPQGEGVSAGG